MKLKTMLMSAAATLALAPAAMAERGVDGVRVVVGSRNQGAIAAYEAMGFERADTIEVHEGESSEVLTWSAR